MGLQRRRTRIRCKIDDLPPDVKTMVDLMLADTRNTYQMVADYINSTSDEISVSKSAVGAYALRKNAAVQRLVEAQEQTRTLLEVARKNPDADYTEGALQIMSGELTRKIAQGQEEWDELSVKDAGKLMVALSRTKVYKDRVRADLMTKTKTALEAFKKEVYAELEGKEPDLCERLIAVANRVAERLEAEE